MERKMTDRRKYMAYVLRREFGYSLTKIAGLMGVSQSTISYTMKDVAYLKATTDISHELAQAEEEAYRLGFKQPALFEQAETAEA